MKKFALLFVVLLSATHSAFSEDIIITTESEKIDAVIETVSDTEVHYKKASNPTGPTFILSTSKIASIIYSNGEVQAFKKTDIETKTEPEQKTENNVAGLQMYKADDMYIYGDLRMDEKEYINFLAQNCPSAYRQYISGDYKVRAAITFLIGGICYDFTGSAFIGHAVRCNDKRGGIIAGSVLLFLGTGLEIACIPTWIVGGRQRANAIDTFNATCSGKTQPQAYWSINASQNGIGLAFNF